MLVTNVEDEIRWWQLSNVVDGFGHETQFLWIHLIYDICNFAEIGPSDNGYFR